MDKNSEMGKPQSIAKKKNIIRIWLYFNSVRSLHILLHIDMNPAPTFRKQCRTKQVYLE